MSDSFKEQIPADGHLLHTHYSTDQLHDFWKQYRPTKFNIKSVTSQLFNGFISYRPAVTVVHPDSHPPDHTAQHPSSHS
jgi:hypothetical protein